MEKPAPCPNGCLHTDTEHRAFDDGFAVGSHGGKRCSPYTNPESKEAWEWGWDYGRTDYREEKGEENE